MTFDPVKAEALLRTLWRWNHLLPEQFVAPLGEALGLKVCDRHPRHGAIGKGERCPGCVEREEERVAMERGLRCAGKPNCDYYEEGWHTVLCPLHRDNRARTP